MSPIRPHFGNDAFLSNLDPRGQPCRPTGMAKALLSRCPTLISHEKMLLKAAHQVPHLGKRLLILAARLRVCNDSTAPQQVKRTGQVVADTRLRFIPVNR